MNAIRLETAGPKGDTLESFMQLANLLNQFRAEYRATGQTADHEIEGQYLFVNGQTRKVRMEFVSQADVMPGLYKETVIIDGTTLPERHHTVWSTEDFWKPDYNRFPIG